jgi:hypothetical protein
MSKEEAQLDMKIGNTNRKVQKSTFGTVERLGTSMLLGGVLASAPDRLGSVFGHVLERATRTPKLLTRQQDGPAFWQLLEIGLMLFVTMLTETGCLWTNHDTIHTGRTRPRHVHSVFESLLTE